MQVFQRSAIPVVVDADPEPIEQIDSFAGQAERLGQRVGLGLQVVAECTDNCPFDRLD